MKKIYVSLVVGVIAGVFCQSNKELELTEEEAKPYLDNECIKRKEEDTEETIPATSTTVLTLDQIKAMDYGAMRNKVAELDLEVADNKTETLKAALISSLEV